MNQSPETQNAAGPAAASQHIANTSAVNPTPIADAAKALAAQGWRIFPLKPGAKLPAVERWQHVAAADASHWIGNPSCNIGILTGDRGVIVLDVDCKAGAAGFASLQGLEAIMGQLPPTLRARTASGGLHYYFSSAEPVRNSASKIGPGLDIRGVGGYVVAPPSVLADGSAYAWESLEPIAPAPAWLVQMATEAAPMREHAAGGPATIEATPEVLEDLADALNVLDADNRGDWIAIGAALRPLGDAGRALWVSWSETSDKHDADRDPDQWQSIGHDATGPAAIFAKAAREGWINPRSRVAQAMKAISASPDAPPVGDEWSPACTELRNSTRIVAAWGARILNVDGQGWHVWAGHRWEPDEGAARRIIRGLPAIIRAEVDLLKLQLETCFDYLPREQLEKEIANLAKWSTSSGQRKVREASLSMAAELITCKAGDLDADRDLLGVPSGVLDLRTGQVRPGNHTDRITKCLGCDFDPVATAPTWEKFICEITGNDADLAGYLQRLAGYALSGRPVAHVLPVFYGSGGNGKTTFLKALENAFGDYFGSAPPGLLVTSVERQHSASTSQLPGKRLVLASESGEFGRLNEDVVKYLTGGDKISARELYKASFSFDPTHVLILQTNHRPRVSGTDPGIWRRLKLVPFTVTIPPDQRDLKLDDKLLAELPGVLAWIYRGLVAYRASGMGEPAAVSAATAEYRSASDQVGTWLAECCIEDGTATATAAELYVDYRTWCDRTGERARSQRDVGLRLTECGFRRERSRDGWRWCGLKLAGITGLHAVQAALAATR